ncbi:hypothetical protein E4T66_14910 [Sinimarinibacterium sp. CAU 1509]|uniref:hypothetical protein n=1 Tax=Sinimarinibacterium sp. CAU 1509 TaxID=2562283 RepID=UPI0010AC3CEA|nr:hypothetical protein [Sinimarinibacterium sp. CAU 1509]TJY58886.1 hypothetical protein E4T66_14910 [Sinimarinibacterium sp. CAU 1509]
MQILRTVLVAAVVVLGFSPLPAPAQDAKAEDIEAARSEMLKRWGVDGLIKASDVEGTATALLARPLGEQPEDQLRELAKRANAAANFVGFILEEYESYYRENYRYDFVKEKIAPFHDAYATLSNRLKSYRNQAYFNLGKKAADRGDEMTAFFMFRDAYRLSGFTEDEGDHKGMRYQAEIEMKKLLGLESMGTFTYWK